MAQQRRPEREEYVTPERTTGRPEQETGRPGRERWEAPEGPQPERWTTAGPLPPIGPEGRIEELELASHATVADAAPLGLAAFAAATFTLGSAMAGWSAITGAAPVAGQVTTLLGIVPMLIIFGGIAQFIAAMWSFRKGDTFWATFLGVFGAFYATIGIGLILTGATGIVFSAIVANVGTGVAIAMFALIAAYLTWAAIGISSVMVWVSGFLTASLALLSTTFFIGVGGSAFLILWAAGYAALASALVAFYASAAVVINSSLKRETLPY